MITKFYKKNIFGLNVMKVPVKSWKNANKQHDQGSKTIENAYLKFQFTFVCLNVYYIIHYTSVCGENEY